MVVAGLTTSIDFASHQMQFSNPASGVRVDPIIFARGESGNQPVGRADRLKEGIKPVYAFFDLEGHEPDDTLRVIGTRARSSSTSNELRFRNCMVPSPTKRAIFGSSLSLQTNHRLGVTS
jgi:hypothetical protein